MSDHRSQGLPPEPEPAPARAAGYGDHHSQHASSHASETCSAEQSPTPVPARRPAPAAGGPGQAAPAAPPSCRVVVADDNPAERAAITAVLGAPGDIAVVAEAADAQQACDAARTHAPDVVLLDVRTPGGDGITALSRLVALAPVLLLTYDRDSEITRQALRLGALGYLVHGRFTDDELRAAVRAVRETRGAAAPPAVPDARLDLGGPRTQRS